MHTREEAPGRLACTKPPASGKRGSGQLPLGSPPLSPNTQHTQTRSSDAQSGRPPGSPGPRHTKPRPRTRDAAGAGAHAHTMGPRSPPRPLAGVPASPAPGSALPAPRPGDAARARGGGAVGARPPRPEPRRQLAGRPPTHPRRCSAAGTAAPAATWRGRRSRCPARRCPRGPGADPAPRRAGPAPGGPSAPRPARPPGPALPSRPALPGSAKFCQRPSCAPPPRARPVSRLAEAAEGAAAGPGLSASRRLPALAARISYRPGLCLLFLPFPPPPASPASEDAALIPSQTQT